MAEPPQSKMHALNNQIDIVIDKMKDNMEQIIKRGENMSDLLDTSEEMEREVSLTAGLYPFTVICVKVCCVVGSLYLYTVLL